MFTLLKWMEDNGKEVLKIVSDELKEQILEEYRSGRSVRDLAAKY